MADEGRGGAALVLLVQDGEVFTGGQLAVPGVGPHESWRGFYKKDSCEVNAVLRKMEYAATRASGRNAFTYTT